MQSGNSLLSVIVPVYNTEKYVYECILSIINQEYQNLDIILVDDGSTDNSGRICDSFVNDKRVRVFHRENEGLMKARFFGVKQAKGKYITFVDSDDWIDRYMYTKLMKPVNLTDVDISTCGIIRVYKKKYVYNKPLFSEGYYEKSQLDNIRMKMIWDSKYECNGIDQSLCCKIIKREFLLTSMQQAAGIDIYYNEDTIIAFPILKDIHSLYICSECLYYHRQKEENLPSYLADNNYFEKMFDFYTYIIDAMGESYRAAVEQYFLYSLSQRKRLYSTLVKRNTCYYPIDLFEKKTKFILYGAGNMGKEFINQYKKIQLGCLVAWVDSSKMGQVIEDIEIIGFDDAKNLEYEYIVLAVYAESVAKEITNILIEKGIRKEKIIWKQAQILEY